MRTRIHRAEHESAASLHAKVNTPRLRTSQSILDSIGRTPLIRLRRMAENVPAEVLVKLESLNPGGSIDDRVGVAMVAEAERFGWLKPGGTIIEATTGNFGVGLALAASVKGYRCIFVVPDNVSREKIGLLKAYGAEIVITPAAAPPDSFDRYNGVADRLACEIPGAWRPNQLASPTNPEIHYRTTGPEIWEQTEGKLTAFVAGVASGGTIMGVGRYLKERNPAVKIIAVDPVGSIPSADAPRSWEVEGLGEDSIAKSLKGQIADEWIRVGDTESLQTARTMAQQEGLLVGRSAGVAVAAALRFAQRLSKNDVVVALCPDAGRNDPCRVYDDA